MVARLHTPDGHVSRRYDRFGPPLTGPRRLIHCVGCSSLCGSGCRTGSSESCWSTERDGMASQGPGAALPPAQSTRALFPPGRGGEGERGRNCHRSGARRRPSPRKRTEHGSLFSGRGEADAYRRRQRPSPARPCCELRDCLPRYEAPAGRTREARRHAFCRGVAPPRPLVRRCPWCVFWWFVLGIWCCVGGCVTLLGPLRAGFGPFRGFGFWLWRLLRARWGWSGLVLTGWAGSANLEKLPFRGFRLRGVAGSAWF